MENFGEKLKELRIEKGLTQKETAKELAISIPTLSHWECNYQEPSYNDLKRLCRFYNVKSDYLLGLEDETGAKITIPNYTIGTVKIEINQGVKNK